MTANEIKKTLDLHAKWLAGPENGQQANLAGANLTRANLTRANLAGANLARANLTRANLTRADILPDLYLLKFQPPDIKLRAWKFLSKNGLSPYQNHRYEVGRPYVADAFSIDERISCDKGLNVATLPWCLRNSGAQDDSFIEVEFQVGDIVAIPFATDGKFRVKALTVLRQITKVEAEKIIADVMVPYSKKAQEER